MFKTVLKIIRWTDKRKKRLYIGFLWSFLAHMFTAMPIMGAAFLLDMMIKDSRGEAELKPIWALYALIFMVVCVLGRFLFSYLKAVFQESIAYEKTAEERIKIGDILKKVSLGFFNKNKTGEICGTVTTDLTALEMYAMKMTDTLVGGYIGAAAMVICIAFYSWQCALICVAGIVLSGFALIAINKKSRKNMPVHQKAQDSLVGSVIEFVRGISVVKSYGRQGAAARGITEAFSSHKKINVKIELDYVGVNILHRLSLNLASAGVVLYSSILCFNGVMPVSTFLMLTVFSFVIFANVENINNSAHTMEMMEATFKKLDKIENADFPIEGTNNAPLENHDIKFKKVSFGYDSRNVINDVSFKIPSGTTTAIVGSSGSGKTTLCSLLTRFYDIDRGEITLGERNICDLPVGDLMENFSMVFQNVYLFNDTIMNNIRFGNPAASEEDIIAAAKKACCHEFISALPGGYDTVVGEGGGTLSGGEKQRISIARAILKNAPIIILDEATASVDPENEHLIQSAITELSKGKTVIVIAHRLATIEKADQILVMDNGRIAERGTHSELMSSNGIYKRFAEIRCAAESWSIQ